LTTTNGSWSNSPTSYTYQWQDCDFAGANCTDISGATGSLYPLASADVNHTIRVAVTASNATGSASASSTATALVTDGAILFGGGSFSEGSWPAGNWEPYASTSPWNKQLPAYGSAALFADSTNEISYMSANWSANFTNQPVSNTPSQDQASVWQHPLYWAQSTDPTYTIHDTGYACGSPSSTNCPTTVQIPNGAEHATGGDGHLSVIQPDGHTEIDFWQVQNANPISGGGTLTVHDYGAVDLNGAGCCGGSTAANQGLAAGSIRGPELASGVINHALTVSEKCSDNGMVAPAVGGTGTTCSAGDAPPMGARLQLKMSDAQIASLSVPAYQKVIFEAMAHYGIFVTDTGGSPMDLYYEPAIQYTSFGNTSNTVMSFLSGQGHPDPTTISIKLPWTDFQVVSPCYAAGTC
jgi:hypothetical protein